MKYCPKCKQRKETADFAKNLGRYDNLQSYCRSCKSLQDHKRYLLEKETHRERVKKYIVKLRLKIWDYLLEHSCVDCGEDNPVVLEFDHRDRVDKKGSISYLLGYSKCSWETLMKEIVKCDVRCANCHRIRTAKQFGWYKYLEND